MKTRRVYIDRDKSGNLFYKWSATDDAGYYDLTSMLRLKGLNPMDICLTYSDQVHKEVVDFIPELTESKIRQEVNTNKLQGKDTFYSIEYIETLLHVIDECRIERDEALSTHIPPDSGALLILGERLTHLLDEDAWNEIEPLLLAAKEEKK